MMRALYSAASGMAAQQTNVDNISNNLANANTAGFKSRQVQFQDLLYQHMVTPGTSAGQQTTVPTGLQVGLGTRTSGNEVIFTQGNFQQTDNPYDLVIQGKGFFQIKLPSGELAYTRAGSFQTDQNGILVDTNGNQLQPTITIPADSQSVTIATDGTVSYTLPNQTASQTAGQIQLANFQNPAGLNSLGQNYFQPTDASGQPVTGNPGGSEGLGTVMQGYTEQSNVSVVNEFINLIVAQRTYEANSKVVKASDEMLQDVNNLKQ
jgi:flagellar basal-body rod protein FlgG